MNNALNFTDVRVPYSEAATTLRRLANGRKVFLQCNQRGYIEGQEDRYFPVMSNVKVSLQAALNYIEGAYAGFAKRGVMVSFMYSERCLFIG